jgi:hypothetical protein
MADAQRVTVGAQKKLCGAELLVFFALAAQSFAVRAIRMRAQ